MPLRKPRLWRRPLRRLLLAGNRRRADVVASARYVFDLPGGTLDPLRTERIVTWLAREGLLRRGDIVSPRLAPWKALRRVHSDAWLESLREPSALLPVLGFETSAAVADAFVRLQRLMTGGTMAAADRALSTGRPALHLGGGFHHATRDRGSGFCAVNDLAAAIAAQRERGYAGPVLVIDLDLHDGEGTRKIFAHDPTVFTFSLHNRHRDDTDAMASLSIEFGSGIDDARYLALLRQHLPPVVREFRPRLVFYVAGTDVAAGDRLGDGQLSAAGIFERDRAVFDLVRRADTHPAVVLVLGGGYGPESWRLSAASIAWVLSGESLEPPPTGEVALDRYREMSRVLSPADLAGLSDWRLTPQDLLADLFGAPSDNRLLGFYSEQGVELVLEQSGLLDRLRAIGFDNLVVRLDADNPAGQTVRVLDETWPDEPLVEMRVRRDRRSIVGCEMLDLEWLLLQNPAASFSPAHQPLAGQRHPGLGISEDILALLVLACERLRLDGILFVPSHYHLVHPDRPGVVALDPAEEGWLRALRRTTAGLPLLDVDATFERGELVDGRTGQPLSFHPLTMVAAVSPSMRARLADPAWQRGVAEAEQDWLARLRWTVPRAAPGQNPASAGA